MRLLLLFLADVYKAMISNSILELVHSKSKYTYSPHYFIKIY